jgi:hypothetical protein
VLEEEGASMDQIPESDEQILEGPEESAQMEE